MKQNKCLTITGGNLMIDINMSYQLILFSNYGELSATSENTMKLMSLFNDYGLLPTTIQELSNTNPTPILRPRFVAPDGGLSITILSQNITIESSYNGTPETIETFVEKASKILDLFMREHPNKGKRIALITKSILSEMPSELLDSIYYKISKPINFYAEKGPFEWSLRSVGRLNYTLAATQEDINAITTVSRVQGQINQDGTLKDLDRISFDFDINTITQNEGTRFSYQEVKDFIQQAMRTRTEITIEMERLIYE
jgi:hypothetical protein